MLFTEGLILSMGREKRDGENDAKPANLLATFDLYHQQCFIYVFVCAGVFKLETFCDTVYTAFGVMPPLISRLK